MKENSNPKTKKRRKRKIYGKNERKKNKIRKKIFFLRTEMSETRKKCSSLNLCMWQSHKQRRKIIHEILSLAFLHSICAFLCCVETLPKIKLQLLKKTYFIIVAAKYYNRLNAFHLKPIKHNVMKKKNRKKNKLWNTNVKKTTCFPNTLVSIMIGS